MKGEIAMTDCEKNWDGYETAPIRQFDMILADIRNVLKTRPVDEAKQYVRGLQDGNRFARKCPEIKQIKEKHL